MKAYLEIEMPRCCNKCPLFVYEGIGICACRVLPAIEDDEILKPWKNRRKDCPLKAVPEHGRLIDGDALAAKCDSPYWCVWLSDIDNAPTIIEAEKENG